MYSKYLYLVVAQLKSTSTSSYSISSGSNNLMYPPSQLSTASMYGALIYITSGSQWARSSSISRAKASLAPISTNSFRVFPDQYGSKRSNYNTNIFISVNPDGQYLYSNYQTGSKMVITWSGLTTTENCQVWVEN